MPTALEKAFLEIEGGKRIACLFNPSSITVGPQQQLGRRTRCRAATSGQLRFLGANSGTLSLDLTFDTTADGTPVSTYTGKLMKLMEVDYTLPGADEATRNGRPRTVIFHWGDLHSFPAVVANVVLSFTYFSSTGVPLRATAQLVLQPVRQVRRVRAAEPDLGHAQPAPRAPRAARRDARPDLGALLRRFHPLARAGQHQRHRGPACRPSRHAAEHPAKERLDDLRVNINQIAPEFEVNGTPLAAVWWSSLISMRVERELNVVGRAMLRFADTGYQLSASNVFALGADRADLGLPGRHAVQGDRDRREPGTGGRGAPRTGDHGRRPDLQARAEHQGRRAHEQVLSATSSTRWS